MKKILTLLFITVVLSGLSTKSSAQPKVTLNLFGGYGVPLGDFTMDVPPTSPLTGENRADADYFPYYTKQFWNFGATGKLAFGQQGNWRVVFGLSDNMYSNSTDAIFKADSTGTLVVTSFEPKVNIFSIILGGEYAFLPKGKVNPFVGLAMPINFFSGDFTFGQSVFVKGKQRTGPMDMKSETRVGLTFDAGVDFMISKQVGIITGLNYNIINLIGKGADDEEEVGPNEIDLGDAEHTLDDGVTVSPSKTLTSFSGYLGVSFFFGAPKTTTIRK